MGRKRRHTKAEVLEIIQRLFLKLGMPPTVEELRAALKVGSTRTVQRYLDWLEEEGDIDRWSGARGLRLRRGRTTDIATIRVPIVGTAPAGALMIAEQNIEGWVQFQKTGLRSPHATHFLLRVVGNSMNKAKVQGGTIESGDLVLVRQQATADQNEVVVVLVDGQATIKRLTRGSGYWILKPESTDSKNKPIVLDQEFQIQGVVTQVLKQGSKLIK